MSQRVTEIKYWSHIGHMPALVFGQRLLQNLVKLFDNPRRAGARRQTRRAGARHASL